MDRSRIPLTELAGGRRLPGGAAVAGSNMYLAGTVGARARDIRRPNAEARLDCAAMLARAALNWLPWQIRARFRRPSFRAVSGQTQTGFFVLPQ
ncbi:MAG: hypothetical protein KGN84_02130 [Acidobacteriota bacterium]|nr:hypothetical protein [Acidobacteriota bacterium]